ncbi:CCR4-NOT transcription complex subunit 11 [Toxocara canis]|uniref:CCR4-NOT transcription complex subunit 11 n=1 Tax=Toxocara canis TaxID=6265 RepID=A0A0B2VKK3_TOXCA|nr:CCR4-NOT transcription complex subunit 11 [Toxocara canis]
MAVPSPPRAVLSAEDFHAINKVGDLDLSVDRRKQSSEEQIEDVLWHPFLAFFISMLEEEKENVSEAVEHSFSSMPRANAYERYLLGHLLTGKHSDIASRTVNDLVQSIYRNEETSEDFATRGFELERYKEALKQREATYSSLASASIPALIKLPDESREDSEETLTRSLLHIACNPFMADILPPSFHRVTPTLMPPSDDEFQFLYPFLLEPLWLDAETLKPDMNVPTSSDHDNTGRSVTNSESKVSSSQSKADEAMPEIVDGNGAGNSLPHTPPSGMKVVAGLAEPQRKWGMSLPSSPKVPTVVNSNESPSVSWSSRTVSLGSLSYIRSNSSDTSKSTVEDTSFAAESISLCSSVTEKEKDKKPPLTHAEAVELMKKSLVSVIARTEAQRLSEAIAADDSITDMVDMPISQYPKFIDDNPIVAAAVIVRRVNKNADELREFFDLLLNMNLSVQGMEVVNKLCTQIEFPQDYLNSYISMCVQRCEDPSQSSFAQCRQVRMVCVFLSSLIRNGNWDVHPLSVELQSFVLKFNHVREAVSLYQAILVALQPPESANSTISSTSIHQDSTSSSICESTLS